MRLPWQFIFRNATEERDGEEGIHEARLLVISMLSVFNRVLIPEFNS